MQVSSPRAGRVSTLAIAALSAAIIFSLLGWPGIGGTPTAAAARTLYVSPSGSDTSGTGSQSKPWRTIGKAVDAVVAGDLVLIAPGTYAETITIEEKHGTAAEPIVFRANGPGMIVDGTASSRDAVFVTYSSYVSLEGWTVRQAPRAGLRIDASHHVTVRGGTFANNGRWGIFTDFSDDLLIENNEAYGSVAEHGIYHSNSGDRPTIRNNRIHDNYAAGLHMNGDISMGGDGIISGALVENNVIYNNGAGGGAAINQDGVTDSIIRNNVLYNNRASGIAVYAIDGGTCSKNNQYLNNTIVMPENGRWPIMIASADCTGNKIFNNILMNAHSYRGAISLGAWPISGFQSDYNVVINRFTTNDGDSILTLAQWQALGNDTHSIISTPANLFVNPATGDFHLKSGSPAIDAGKTLANVLTDRDGNARPSGSAYDAGAYERGGAPGPTPTATATPGPSPSCTIPSDRARVGFTVRLSCTGFAGNEPVQLFIGSASNTPIGEAVADAAGATTLTGKIPEMPGGRITLIARGTSSKARTTVRVTVEGRVALAPRSGPTGTRVSVKITGFRAGEVILVRWYVTSTSTRTLRSTLTANAAGSAAFSFSVPSNATLGGHKVEARGSLSSRAAAVFSVAGVAAAEVTPESTAVPPTSTPPAEMPTVEPSEPTPPAATSPTESPAEPPTIEPTAPAEEPAASPTPEPTV